MLKTVYFLWFQHYGVALEKRCPNCLSYNIILELIIFMIHNLPIIPQTRIQSCETLKLCITSYGIGCTEEHLILIWNDVKQEIFGGVNKDLRERQALSLSPSSYSADSLRQKFNINFNFFKFWRLCQGFLLLDNSESRMTDAGNKFNDMVNPHKLPT